MSHLKMFIKRDSSNSKCVVYIRDPDSVRIQKKTKKQKTDYNFSLQHLGVLLQALRPPPRWRKVISGWGQDPQSTALLPHHWPIRKKSALSRSWQRLWPLPRGFVPQKLSWWCRIFGAGFRTFSSSSRAMDNTLSHILRAVFISTVIETPPGERS